MRESSSPGQGARNRNHKKSVLWSLHINSIKKCYLYSKEKRKQNENEKIAIWKLMSTNKNKRLSKYRLICFADICDQFVFFRPNQFTLWYEKSSDKKVKLYSIWPVVIGWPLKKLVCKIKCLFSNRLELSGNYLTAWQWLGR